MNIRYKLLGTREYKKIYVRLYHHKLDIPVNTNLITKTEDWDATAQLFKRNNIANKQLIELKINIENAFNSDYATGTIINKDWLTNIVAKTFLRPSKEENLINPPHTIYLCDFGQYWLDNHAKTYRTENATFFTPKAITQHTKALQQLKEFQGNRQIKMIDFDLTEIKNFYYFLIDQDYAVNTAKKTLTEVKFLCKRAKELKFNINLDFEVKTVFKDNSPEIEDIYLNESEIETIFKHDFSNDEYLDYVRDNFIINLWTGIRINDFVNLDQNNFINGIIETTTSKTNTIVKIPLHPQVKAVLAKRNGLLPPKVTETEYNIQIKEICRICGINAQTFGKVFDSTIQRKVAKYYHKYELVTSHIARRSFATNLSNKLSSQAISKIAGWSTDKMAKHYNKKSKLETAQELENIWNS
jgi:hypothetical protein